MSLESLTPDEDLALLGMLREVVTADAKYTDLEKERVDKIEASIGEARFRRAMAEAEKRFKGREDLKAFLKGVSRQAARQAIYDALRQLAESDGIDEREDAPLRWLASWWDIAAADERS